MALGAAALQLAGFLLAHGLWTISELPAEGRYTPQALCETSGGERRLVSFDAADENVALAEADAFMGSTAGQFAQCAFARTDEVRTNQGATARALLIELTGREGDLTVLQAYRPAHAEGGFRLLGDELLLDMGGTVLPRADANPAIVSLREGAADHPGLDEKWVEWNTGRDPANPLTQP